MEASATFLLLTIYSCMTLPEPPEDLVFRILEPLRVRHMGTVEEARAMYTIPL